MLIVAALEEEKEKLSEREVLPGFCMGRELEICE